MRLQSFRLRLLVGGLLALIGLQVFSHLVSNTLRREYTLELDLSNGRLAILAAALLVVVGLFQLRKGLSPFDRLRVRLAAVRDGGARRLEGRYPSEVQPLVDDLNGFLDHREQVVERALARAGDLAHGLKTPLAVLAQEAERAAEAGHHELANTLVAQVERMRRQIDYQLAQARAAASGATPGAHCAVLASAEGLRRTLLRLHAERALQIDLQVAPAHAVRCQREDLDEMLGNLLDNACRFARARICVESLLVAEGRLAIVVDDDGPGLALELREAVLQRGVRADEAVPGSGLGLAIVRELAELHGGGIALEAAPMGGVRARLVLIAG
jgi:signal transduction histidine kinase